MHEYEWPRPMVTVDMILFRLPLVVDLSDQYQQFEVLMVKRLNNHLKVNGHYLVVMLMNENV